MDSQGVLEGLIGVHSVALLLGVDVATLQRWHSHHAGPPAATGVNRPLAYLRSTVELWQDRLGNAITGSSFSLAR